MEHLKEILRIIDSFLGSSPWFPYVLLGTGLFFTIYLKFPQFRYFRHAIDVVKGKYEKSHHVGDTSHFQALSTALSGTVGTGNIGGVAFAIFLGGPSALFWMWMTAFLGMCTKFVEVMLSHKYREKTVDGTISGGPMYYMKHRLNFTCKNGKVIKTGVWLGCFFAMATVICSFGTGNLPQINNIAAAMKEAFGIDTWITGAVLAILLGLIIIGGIKRIAQVAERIVPTMAFFYLLGAFAVLIYNYENILPAFESIFANIFTGHAAVGGFMGATFSYAFSRGVARGLFSNEAGQGSAPIAHASAKAEEPVSESMVAMLEPFIDTIIICTITGLVIVASGSWKDKFPNKFAQNDLVIVAGDYQESNPQDKQAVWDILRFGNKEKYYTGTIEVQKGKAVNKGYTIIHARSFAEDVEFYYTDETGKQSLYTGLISIKNGNLQPTFFQKDDGKSKQMNVSLYGKSLVHSAQLSTQAFKRSLFGDYGQYIIAISLLLFAFTTTVSWSYYGDRAVIFLFGYRAVFWYHLFYVAAFFCASLVDTSIVWAFADVAIAVMALPNLLGLWLLHREVKSSVKEYAEKFNEEYPNKKISI